MNLHRDYMEHRKQYPLSRATYLWRALKRNAEVGRRWENAERAGLVRFELEPDQCGWDEDDLFGDTFNVEVHGDTVPGGERTILAEKRRAVKRVEEDGVWVVAGYYRTQPGAPWVRGDAVGGVVGYSEEEHEELIVDVKDETLALLAKALRRRCPECRQVRKENS